MILYFTVMVIRLYNIEKDIEGLRTNNIIQYNNNILVL